ncbi:MAG: sulfite exporter TauE/SafE family protein, partial [Halobacteria archaeon]|nr:sulfite exporter TauE/SafE family protein [Halobacteria archaeon]
MIIETSYVAAFLVGLLGGVHCVGLCGGIVGALSFGLSEDIRQQPRRM